MKGIHFMKVTVIGAGYVGLTIGLCFARSKHQVLLLERDERRLTELKAGRCPFYEPYAQEWLTEAQKDGTLTITNSAQKAISFGDIIWIAVNTPAQNDGQLDISALKDAMEDVLAYRRPNTSIVIKSTVTAGTCRTLLHWIREQSNEFSGALLFCPEFLREGHAIEDFLHPSRIILGTEKGTAPTIIKQFYRSLGLPIENLLVTTYENAEVVKQASNSFLAVKLTYINELDNYCNHVNADINTVSYCMGLDPRIAPDYMKSGLGYGGACLPKDTKALATDATRCGTPLTILEQAIIANEMRMNDAAAIISKRVSPGSIIAVWGLTFKPGSSDVRCSPAWTVLRTLIENNTYQYQLYDPFLLSWQPTNLPFPSCLRLCKDIYEAVHMADALVILTAHEQFCQIDLSSVKSQMRGDLLFDFFHCFPRDKIAASGLRLVANMRLP